MPVDTKSPQYLEMDEKWQLIYDLEDEDRMKEAGTDYVPKLSEQTDDEYDAYVERGSLYGAFNRTVRGLTGAVMRKEPIVHGPAKLIDMLEDVTVDGLSFNEVTAKVTRNVIKYGYCGILPDVPQEGGSPRLAPYLPTTILYPVEQRMAGKMALIRLTLQEKITNFSEEDPYKTKDVDQVRELDLSEDGIYIQKIWQKGDGSAYTQVGEDIVPRMVGGKPFNYIPFVFFGAIENSVQPKDPPLIDLANLNKKHFVVGVDYYHGLHFCGLPVYWAAGFPMENKLYVGSFTAWQSSEANARCGILQASKDSLSALAEALDKLEKQMAVVGSRMIEQQRRGVETAEGLLIRQASDFAVLSDIASNVESGMTRALKICAEFMGLPTKGVEVIMNKDFTSDKVDPQVVQALFQAMQGGNLSFDSFLSYLKDKELLPSSRTIEEEKMLIKSADNQEFINALVATTTPVVVKKQLEAEEEEDG